MAASSASEVVRKLPPVERVTKLREKLPGVDLTCHQEPSYELVNAFSAMLEACSVRWAPFYNRASREQELSARSFKKELQVTQSQDGKLSLKEGQASLMPTFRMACEPCPDVQQQLKSPARAAKQLGATQPPSSKFPISSVIATKVSQGVQGCQERGSISLQLKGSFDPSEPKTTT